MQVFLDGQMMPLEQARISPLDRGFIYGDGVYELIPALGGRPFRLKQHMDRLNRNLDEVRIERPYSDAGWLSILSELTALHPGADSSIYIQITRGVAPRDHAFPKATVPTVFAMCNPMAPVPAVQLTQGIAAVTLEDYRWGRCDIKATSLLANVMMRQAAIDESAIESILVRYGMVTEAAASNVFAVFDGEIHTAPEGPQILPGVTRALALDLAHKHGFEVKTLPFPLSMLRRADEIWISSSTKDILPITQLDGAPVGDGRPGPVWQKLYGIFQDYKAAFRAGQADSLAA